MIQLNKNNVHVSGRVLEEQVLSSYKTELIVGVQTKEEKVLPVKAVVETDSWETFKEQFPNRYNSVTISGRLSSRKNEKGIMQYSITGKNIACFHNVLKNEATTQFYGAVKLLRKFDFDTESNLYLKRFIFETLDQAIFEAVALRGAVPFFENINEGDCMLLKANYIADKSDKPPYWRIRHRPEL